jgi:hypothetical protein
VDENGAVISTPFSEKTPEAIEAFLLPMGPSNDPEQPQANMAFCQALYKSWWTPIEEGGMGVMDILHQADPSYIKPTMEPAANWRDWTVYLDDRRLEANDDGQAAFAEIAKVVNHPRFTLKIWLPNPNWTNSYFDGYTIQHAGRVGTGPGDSSWIFGILVETKPADAGTADTSKPSDTAEDITLGGSSRICGNPLQPWTPSEPAPPGLKLKNIADGPTRNLEVSDDTKPTTGNTGSGNTISYENGAEVANGLQGDEAAARAAADNATADANATTAQDEAAHEAAKEEGVVTDNNQNHNEHIQSPFEET